MTEGLHHKTCSPSYFYIFTKFNIGGKICVLGVNLQNKSICVQ